MPRPSALALLFALALAAGMSAHAAEPSLEEKTAREGELRRLQGDLKLSRERLEALRHEIEGLKADRAKLTQAAIETAARIKIREAEITAAEDRLAKLKENETGIRASLASRRAALAELLAAMQRIGRAPPPAILASPDDALRAVRAALLMGAVLPELQIEAEALASDLTELVTLEKRMSGERDALQLEAGRLTEERGRLGILLEEKKNREAASERDLSEERQRVNALASGARSLEELISRMEGARAAEATAATGPAGNAFTALDNPSRMKPAVAFAAAHGLLALPASGVRLRAFGDPDGFGGAAKGVSIATRVSAQVTAPSDGWVVYAGPFRSYGQLLIINAGGGYHLLLAGMERIDVQLGQFVLAGEPVAVMGGSSPVGASAIAPDATQPILYVEFRKDGVAVDSAPWWAARGHEKVRG